MACLDTDVMISFLRKDPAAIGKIKGLLENNHKLTTTPINAIELFIGAYKSKNMQINMVAVDKLLKGLICLSLDFSPSNIIGSIIQNLEKKGLKIEDFDALIGGIALHYNEILITRNVGHFKRIDGLKIETW